MADAPAASPHGKEPGLAAAVASKLDELRSLFDLRVPGDLSHYELQALVASLTGLALERGNPAVGSIAAGRPVRGRFAGRPSVVASWLTGGRQLSAGPLGGARA